MQLIEIDKRLPRLVYNYHTVDENGDAVVQEVPVVRVTEAHRAAAHAAFVRPPAPWLQKLADGTTADRPFEHTGNEDWQRQEENQFRHRKAAVAAIALGVSVDDPRSPGSELSWQSIAAGQNAGDRTARREEYAREAGLIAIDRLTADEIDAIIAIASGADVDADGNPIERGDADSTNEGTGDLVAQLGNSSAPTSGDGETATDQ